MGLIKNNTNEKTMSCTCQIVPSKTKKPVRVEKSRKPNNVYDTNKILLLRLGGNLKLKNFAHLFANGPLSETSSYIEVPGCKKRFICKKTSLCWLLTKESSKLSSDRLLRVRGTRGNKKTSNYSNYAKKSKKIKPMKLMKQKY